MPQCAGHQAACRQAVERLRQSRPREGNVIMNGAVWPIRATKEAEGNVQEMDPLELTSKQLV